MPNLSINNKLKFLQFKGQNDFYCGDVRNLAYGRFWSVTRTLINTFKCLTKEWGPPPRCNFVLETVLYKTDTKSQFLACNSVSRIFNRVSLGQHSSSSWSVHEQNWINCSIICYVLKSVVWWATRLFKGWPEQSKHCNEREHNARRKYL